jgi:hypothetical protein
MCRRSSSAPTLQRDEQRQRALAPANSRVACYRRPDGRPPPDDDPPEERDDPPEERGDPPEDGDERGAEPPDGADIERGELPPEGAGW